MLPFLDRFLSNLERRLNLPSKRTSLSVTQPGVIYAHVRNLTPVCFDPGGATFLKVVAQFRERNERKNFDPHLLHTWEDIKQNIAQFSLS